jgi:hypothetical protein
VNWFNKSVVFGHEDVTTPPRSSRRGRVALGEDCDERFTLLHFERGIPEGELGRLAHEG